MIHLPLPPQSRREPPKAVRVPVSFVVVAEVRTRGWCSRLWRQGDPRAHKRFTHYAELEGQVAWECWQGYQVLRNEVVFARDKLRGMSRSHSTSGWAHL